MNKHTAGPWIAKELGGSFDEPRWVILWPDTSKGGVHMRRLDDHGEFDKEAAQVMSAARELLESLQSLLDLHVAHHNEPKHAAARAVIAKAKGIADATS